MAGAVTFTNSAAHSRHFARALTLCGLVALLDGFDTQAIAYVAPVLSAEWGVPRARFGPAFGAALLGMMVGALVFGPVADRVGRKPTIVVATLLFGLFALATARAETMSTLVILRALTGIGLGAAIPNIIALTAEHAPPHRRALAVSAMFCGFPLGSLLGGLAAPALMARHGWEGIFVLGGALPLLLVPVLLVALPESPSWSAGKRGERTPAAPLGALFRGEFARITPLLWTTFFASLLVMYFLVNWLPTIFVAAGQPLAAAIRTTVTLNIGGIVGALMIARAIDRVGATRVLVPVYAVAAACIAAIGWLAPASPLMSAAIFFAGFGIVGGAIGCNALAASIYPTASRSAGVGWALGVGRLGSVLGPVAAGAMMTAGIGDRGLFAAAAAVALMAALALALLAPALRHRADT